ncbi:MAG: hypothetical protein M1503_10250 [Thaumarchaeota archaeon]|nr:hypothetical protein [Nitrososphaerota archaeon]MCL5318623.1 hypothetical protein [Nitrososphaerota archaeon]
MFGLQIFTSADTSFWWLLLVLLIIGLVIIVAIDVLVAFPIASLAAIAIYLLTGSLVTAGIVFLITALVSVAVGSAFDVGHRHRHRHVHIHEED